MKNKILIPLLIALFAFVVVPTAALAAPASYKYHFNVVQTGVAQSAVDILYNQLYVDVTKSNGGMASFTFHNDINDPKFDPLFPSMIL